MDINSIVTILGEQITNLKPIWNEIGLSSQEREERISILLRNLNQYIESFVRKEEQARDHLLTQIFETSRSIEKISRALGEPIKIVRYDHSITHGSIKRFEDFTTKPLILQLPELESEYDQLQQRMNKRVKDLSVYHDNIIALREDLGLSSSKEQTLDVSDVSIERLQSYHEEFNRLSHEKEQRTEVVESLKAEIWALWEILGTNFVLESTDKMDLAILEHTTKEPKLNLSTDTIAMLEDKRDSLTQVKSQREEQVRQYGIQIIGLWDQLQVPVDKRSEFFAKAPNLSVEVISACEDEIRRLESLKKQQMEHIIKQCRSQILELWQLLRISQEERKEFSAFFVDVFNQEVLDLHEEKIRELAKQWEEMYPIINMIKERESILERKREFESTTSDPNRLLSKAPRDPGRLLKEERDRKTFTKTLPKLEIKLMQSIKDWEREHNQPFTLNGQRYLDTVQPQVVVDNKRTTPLKTESPRGRTPVADRHLQASIPLSPYTSNIHNLSTTTTMTPKTQQKLKRAPEGKENGWSKIPKI